MKKFLLPIFASFMIVTGIGSTQAEAATQTDLTATASQYIGVPYVYGGTSTSGFDCSGFTQYVYKKLGVSLNRTAASQFTQGTSVSKANLVVGDLVFFNTTGKTASHVGIYIGNNKFIHAGSSTGVTTASLGASYWAPKYSGARHITNFTSASDVAAAASEVKGAEIDFTVYVSRGEVALKLAQKLGLDTSNTESPFADVKSSSKYAGAVTALHKAGVFNGDQNGKFNPNSALTREEMAIILVEAFDLKNQGTSINFTDVSPNAWSYSYIQNLASNGVTLGIGNNLYGKLQNVTYTQLTAFMERAEKLK